MGKILGIIFMILSTNIAEGTVLNVSSVFSNSVSKAYSDILDDPALNMLLVGMQESVLDDNFEIPAVAPAPAPNNATACEGTNASFVADAGVSYQWEVSINGGASWSAIGGETAQTLTVTSVTLSMSGYQYRCQVSSVPSSPATLTVTQLPILLSSLTPPAICNNSFFIYTPTSTTAGTTFSWSRAAVAGISNTAASGTGNPNEPLSNTTTSVVNVTYVYTLSANGCTNPTSYNVVVAVNPAPALTSSLTPPEICSGAVFNYTPTSSTPGVSFSWSRAFVPGISNAAGSGSDNPSETLYNTTTGPVNAIYVYSLSLGGCSSTYSVKAVVNPTPILNSSLTAPVACSGIPYTYAPSSVTSGATFAWSRATVSGISNASASGTGSLTETLVNTNSSPVVVTYTYAVSANGCTNPVNSNVSVTVNPAPSLTSSLTPAAICNNSFFNYTPTSSTTGVTFAWSRATIAGISNPASSGTGNPNETLSNATAVPVNVTYVYSLSANGCTNPTTFDVDVTVNPAPILTSSINPPAICSGAAFSYTPTSSTSGVSFSWSRDLVAGIGNAAASGSDNPNEILVNTTTASVNVTYVYTLNSGGCSSTYNVTVAVNPTATLNSSLSPPAICSGTTFSYTPTSGTAGAAFGWSRAAVAGISNAAASGTGNPNETLFNTSSNPVLVTYTYSVSSNGCTNPVLFNVVVTINPTPALTSLLSPPAVCSGATFSYTPTSATAGTTFSWSRAVVAGIGNAALSGLGNPGETLNNTTSASANVTYAYTLSANGCANPAAYNVVVAVNPVTVLSSSLTPPSICSGTAFSYTPVSPTAGTAFTWSRAVVAGISNALGSGSDNPNETLTNTTASPLNVVYAYSLTANGCTNTQNVVVTVNPSPVLTSSLTPPAICSGTAFSYTPTSSSAGAIFGWSRALVAGISNVAASGSGDPNETLINATTAPITVTYVYSVTVNGCTNPTTYNVTVVVSPSPVLSSSLTPPAICSGTVFSYSSSSLTAGTTFRWSRAVVSGISNVADSGWGNVNETLVNVTNAPVTVTYVYNLDANGCSNAQNVSVVVNPTPSLSSSLIPPAICSNTTFNYIPTSGTVGSTFGWSRASVAGIGNTASSGAGDPNETLVSTSISPVNVTYVYTIGAGGCSSNQSVVVSVNPSPTLTSLLSPPTICTGAVFSYVPTSATVGASFAWSRALVAGISNVAASGTNNPNEPLNNTTATKVPATYDYILSANGCTNPTPYHVTVDVDPVPVLTSILTPPAICSGTSFSYTPTSSTTGVVFTWSRAAVSGISNVAANGSDNPNETLVNTTGLPVSVTYVYTLNAGGCINSQNVAVVVNPAPLLSSSLTPPAICNGTVFIYTPTSGTPGAVFGWSRAAVAGISNAAASGSGNPNETLVSTSVSPVSVTYVYTTTANGCSNSQNVVVTVNPSPTLTSLLSPPAICTGSVFSYTPTSATAGTTFSWSRAAVAGISNASASGLLDPGETLNNTTSGPVNVTYIYTLSSSGCTNSTTYNVVVAVNPSPVLTSSLNPPAICSGTSFSYVPTSTTSGVTFGWNRAVVAGISNAAASGSDNPNEALVNTTTAPVNVTYVYTLNAGGCSSTYNVTAVVNPSPFLSSSLTPPAICSGTVFSYTPTSGATGATFNWSRSAVAGISNAAASGVGNPNETLVNTTSAPVDVTYIYTLSANSCSKTQNVTVRVNPTTALNSSLLLPAICSGTTLSYTPTSATTGATFAWSRAAVPGISNATASGFGNPNESLVNTGTSPVTVTYVYTVSANGCTNPSSYNVIVDVNPLAILTSSLLPAAICSGTTFNYTPTSTTAGVTFGWSRAAVVGISNISANGLGDPNETLINTTTSPIHVTYVYTLTANGCSNTQNIMVTVNPSPVLTSSLTPPGICSGTAFGYTPTSSTAGVAFAWSRVAVAGISNLAGSGTNNPNETLTNTTTAPVNVTYVYTLSANGCTNPTTYNIIVAVNPSPVLSSGLTPPAICSGATFSYIPASSTAGTTLNWSRAVVSGISNLAASGLDNPNETLVNTTGLPVSVTYVYSLDAHGCTNSQNVAVVVNPAPSLSSSLTPPAICNGTVFSYTPTSGTPGAVFGWSRAAVAGISNAAASGSGNPNETLVSTSVLPVSVTYVFTTTANGCSNAQNVVLTVNPSPTLTSLLSPPAICTGSVFSYTPTSATAGTTFSWSRAAVGGISNAPGSGLGDPGETLINTTASPVNVTYIYTLSANGCTNGTTYNVVVSVNPSPILTSSLNPPVICSGTSFSYTPTSSTAGVSFTWARAVVAGISNAAAGGSDNPNEALVNTTAAQVNVTYVYTLNAGGCSSTYNVVVAVNPSPTLSSILNPPSICSGTVFSYNPTSATVGATFAWSRAAVAGISNAPSSGAGDPLETLVNTTASPVTVTYVYTVTATGCTNPTTYNVAVVVNPRPTLTSLLLPPAICSGSPFNYTPTSSTVGASFSWSRAAVVGISNAATNGLGNPNEVLINTTTSPVPVTYVYTVSANGCASPITYNVAVVINPVPVLTSSLTPPDICSNTIFNYLPSSSTTGATFGWTRAVVAGISNAPASGSGNPGEVLVNTTASPVSVTYVYSVTANGCSNNQNVTVNVNPIPVLTSSLTPPAICSGTVFSYTPLSLTGGVVYNWSRGPNPNISNAPAVGINSPNEILINSTTAPVTVDYVYTLSANGCSNVQTVSVVVSPMPVLSSSLIPPAVCSGDVFSYTPTSATIGVTFTWNRAAVIGVSNPASAGSGNPIETLINTTAAPVNVTYVYTLTGNGCINTQSVVVVVNPLPVLTSTLTPPAVCNNTSFSYAPVPSAGGIVTGWTRAAVAGISNPAASGGGNPNETLVNSTTAPINVTYVYTITATGCSNTQNVVVSVNPTPAFTSGLAPAAVCSGIPFSYTPTSTTAGAVFSWNRAGLAGISNGPAVGTGDPNETLINITALPITVTYVYTTSINGCDNPVKSSVKVDINPSAVLTSSLTPASVCSGTAFTYTPTVLAPLTAGTTFTWTRAIVAGISNPAGSGSNGINETLVNTSTAPVVVTYVYTLVFGGCTNTQNVTVTINPTPVLTSVLTPPDICSNALFSYTPTSLTAGTTFNWNRLFNASISNPVAAGIDKPNETLVNTSALPTVVTYAYSLNANGCTNVQNITVTVNPNPTLTSSLTPPAICSNNLFTYAPTSLTPGVTFNWSRAAIAGISNAAAIGADNPNETLVNTSAAPIPVTYVYTLAIGACTRVQNVVVVVNPSPILTSSLTPPAICNGTSFVYTATSATAGTVFAWSRGAVAGISTPASSGLGNVNEVLVNTSTLPINVTYIYTLTANGCTNTQNVVVSVNPTPVMTSTLTPASVCSSSVFNYSPLSTTPGAVFSWTRAGVLGISNAVGAGTGDPNEILVNTTFLPITVSYIYTLSINGCASATTYTVSVDVIPSSVLTSGLSPTPVCSNSVFTYNHTESIPGTTISWSRALTPGISNAASNGTGNISEILINTTTSPVNVTYLFTLSYGGCNNIQNVVVPVEPLPVLSSTLTPSAICNNTAFGYLPTSATPGTLFNWSRPAVAGISTPVSSGTDNPNEILVNTTTLPINVTYVYTLTANGCSHIQNVLVTVNPSPVLTSSLTTPDICSNAVFSYTPASSSSGVTFNWSRASVPGISNLAASGIDNPNETLINISTAPVTVTYLYTLSANGCTNPASYSVTVVVNPVPVLTSSLVPPAICSNTNFSYLPTSSAALATFAWRRAAVPGIINATASGIDNPNEILVNTTSNAIDVTYVYTVTANGCTNPATYSVVVSVKPAPVLTSTLNPASVCSGSNFSYIPTSSSAGVTFTWNRAMVVGISNGTSSGTGNPNETLVNTTALPVIVTYVYTLSANGCTNPLTYSVNVTVNPFPALNSSLSPPAICSGSVFSYTPTSFPAIAGTVFSWNRAAVAGISNASASGTGDPNELLVNTTTSPVTVTYAYSLTAGGCTNPGIFNVQVVVQPNMLLSSSLTPPAICSGGVFSYNPTSPTPGVTFSWSRALVPGISNAANSGLNNPNETLTNTTVLPVIVTYVYTLSSGGGCTQTYNVPVTVNPTPDFTGSLTPPAVCSGTVFSYTPSSGTPGAVFSWSRSAVAGISNAVGSGTGNPNETLVNTTSNPVTVTYGYTVTANGCSSAVTNVQIVVNPSPVLSSTLTPASICSGDLFVYTATSNTAGTTFAWSRTAIAGISNAASSGLGNISETLVNTTGSAINVTYVYSLTAGGCTNPASYSVVVSVKPTPVLTSSLTPPAVCSGSSFSYTPTSSSAGVTCSWNRPFVVGISNAAGSGTGDPHEILINTTALPVVVTYVYSLAASGCTSVASYSVVVTVNPFPTLTSGLSPPSICSGSTFSYTPASSATGTTYAWSRAVVAGISNAPANNTGNVNEALVNTTSSPINVTYVYTLTANGCSNTQNVVIRVNPSITLSSSLNPPSICSNSVFSYIPASSTAGVSFDWSRSAVAGISNTSSTGLGNPNETLISTTAAPVVVSYSYNLSANGCNNVQNVLVTVNPTPALSSSLTPPSICGGTVFSYTPTSNTPGAVFSWSRASVVGISNAVGSGTGNPNETLVNTTTAPVTVTYLYTVSANGCTNPATYSVQVVVNPSAVLTSALTPPAVCSGDLLNYTATSTMVGTTLSWSRAAVAGISNPASSGNGNVSETLVNTNSLPVNVIYVYTLTSNGCTSTQNVVATVNPTPKLTSNLTAPVLCSGSLFSYVPTSSTPGTLFSWSRAVVAGISNGLGSGMGNPNETLINTTALPVVVTYVYTLSANGCTNSSTYSVNVTVNPFPTLTSTPTPPAICGGTIFSYTPTSLANGTLFSWTRAVVAGISNASASGTGNPNETLINTTTSPITVTYAYSLSVGGCTNPSIYNVQVVVNPVMTLSSTLTPPSICSGLAINYIPTSSSPGVAFNWSRALVAGISNPAATGIGSINETLVNTSALPVVVTYAYSLSSGGCTNSYNVLVTVNPTPALTSSLIPPSICSNTVFSYVPTSGTPGTIFTWVRPLVAGISNPASSGTGNPNETLINTTSSPISVPYTYSLSAGGCSNSTTYTVVVTVNPAPSLSSSLNPAAICSTNQFNYIPSSTIAGAVMTWSRAVVPGIIQTASSGSGNISEFLTNATTSPVNVAYQYTLAANGCSNVQSVVVVVNPSPVLTSSLTPPAVCSGTIFHYAATSATIGTVFNWTRTGLPGILQPASSGTGDVNETLTNTTNAPVVVTYSFNLTANGCVGTTYDVKVTVNPTPQVPVITPPGPVSFCAGGNVILSAPSGYSSYLWSNGASTQNITVTTAGSYSVVVKDGNGCQSASSVPVTTTILPSATVYAGSDGLICAGSNFSITGASASNYSSFVWSSSGTGTFISNTTLAPTYVPSAADQTAGVVTLTLTAYSITPCTATVHDDLLLNIRSLPAVNAGADKIVCYPATILVTGTATYYQNPVWTHNGTGTLTGGSSLTPTYHPGAADVGSIVKLTLSVDALNPCSSTITDFMLLQVDALPGNPGAISGPAGSRCKGTTATYSVLPISGATDYNWSLPTGITILSGANSNTINVSFGADAVSGNITIYASNSCGNSTVSTLPVVVTDVPSNPGSISGNPSICQGTTGEVFSVTPITGVTSYTWTVPSGATITSVPPLGNSITVDFGLAAIDGNVTVYATNTCGDGPTVTKAIKVNIKPATPVITATGGPTTFCEGGSIRLQGPTNGFNYLWSPGGATTQTNDVTASGNYSVVITDPLTGCSSAASNIIPVVVNPAPAAPASSGFITQCLNGGAVPVLNAATNVTAPAGTTITWYNAAVGGSVVALPTLSTIGTVTYYAESRNNVTGCLSLIRTPVKLTISDNPAPPVAGLSITSCEQSPAQTLIATATSAAGTTILWYTTPSGGLPVSPTLSTPGTATFYAEASNGICTSLTRSAGVTLTILPAPAAPASGGDITQCLDATPVTYTATATAPAGSTVVWYAFPSGGTAVSPVWSSLGSKTYYAESKNSTTLCASLVRTPVTINIISHPAPPVAVNLTECEKSPLQTLTFLATVPPGSTVKWYTTVSGGLPLATTPTLHAIGTATYYAETDNGICSSFTRTAVTMQINPAPPAPVSLGDKTICETSPFTVLKADDQIGAQGIGISLKWYPTASGGTEVINATLGSVGTITYYAEAYNVATTCVSLTRSDPVKLTVNDTPAQPVTTLPIEEACQTSAGVTLTATANVDAGATLRWYTAANGGTLVATPILSSPGTVTYWAEALLGSCSSYSPRTTSVKLTINPAPAPPVVTALVPKCESVTPTVTASATVPTGNDVVWYTAATGGSPVLGSPPVLTGPGKVTYYAETRNQTTLCSSLTRTAMTLEIKATPAPPVSDGDKIECATSPVQTLTASATSPDGSPIKWYTSATGGSPVGSPTLTAVGTKVYYAEADNGSCQSISRAMVTLKINPSPLPPKSVKDLVLCSDDPVIATGTFDALIANVEWFVTSTGGQKIDHTPVYSELGSGTTTYYAGSVDAVTGCQSPTRTPVNVTINPQALVPVKSKDLTECVMSPVQVLNAKNAIDVPTDGAKISWYTTETGGKALTTEPTLNKIGTKSYWAEASLGGCVNNKRTEVKLTILPVPLAPALSGTSNHLTACETVAGLDANSAIVIAPQTTIKWYDAPTNGVEVSPIQKTPGDRTLYAEAGYDTGCTSLTRTKVILTVNPNPEDLTAIDITECANTPPQTLTAKVVTPPAGVTVIWYDALTNGNIVTAPTLDQIGTKPYYASALLGSCTSLNRTKVTLILYDKPATPVSTGDILECESALPINANSAINNPDPAITIKWFDQPVNGFEVASPVLTFIGTKTFYAEARNASDCPSPARTAVKMTVLKTPPTPISKGDIGECEKTPLQTLDANAAIVTVSGYTTVWYDDNGVLLTTLPTLNKIGTVTYYAAYQESSARHCESVRKPVKLTLSSPPKATAYTNTPLTLGSDLHLNGGPKGTDYTYQWTAPSGITYMPTDGNVSIPKVIASDAGKYQLTVTSISTGCATTVSTQVVIYTATAGAQQVCMGGTLVLTGWPDNMASYDWSGPDGFASTLQNPYIDNINPKNEGVYTLKVTDNKGIQSTGTVNVTINPLPEPFAQANTPVCQTGILQLAGGPDDMYSYSWSGPNGYNSILQNPLPITTPVPGNYVLTVVDKINHCSTSDTIVVEILKPKASYEPICLGNTLRLRAEPSGMQGYKWTGPAGFTSNLQFPTIQNITAANMGNYFLTITDNSGCTPPNVSTTVALSNPPNATIAMSPNMNPICEGSDVTLTGGPTGATETYTYEWTGPNGFSSYEQNPPVIANVKAANAGVYTLKVTNAAGCSSSAQFTLSITAVKFNATYGPYCVNDSKVALSVSPASVVLSGNGISGSSAGGYYFDPAVAKIGTHAISYSYTNGVCNIKNTLDIEVVGNPKVVTNPVVLKSCSGVTADLTLPQVTTGSTLGLIFTYWTDMKMTSAVVAPKAVGSGLYFIKGATASGKCWDVQPVTVGQPDSLQATISASPILNCPGDSTGTLTVNVIMGTAPYNYQWSTQPVQNTVTATGLRAGLYTVVVTDAKMCSAAFTGEITEPTPIKLGFVSKPIQCLSDANGSARVDTINGSADLTLLNSYKYLWNTKPVQTTREALRLTAWWHTVTLTSPKGCVKKDSVYINVQDVTPPTINCPKDIEMTVQYLKSTDGSPNKYVVDLGKPYALDNCQVDTVTNDSPAKFRTGLTYVVWTVTDQMGMMDTCTQRIFIKEIPTIPQLISPNGDGVNDTFVIDGLNSANYENTQLLIFTRSGQLIFQSNNYELPANAWDGRYSSSSFNKNQLVAPGVYYYILKLGGGSSQTMKGYLYVYY